MSVGDWLAGFFHRAFGIRRGLAQCRQLLVGCDLLLERGVQQGDCFRKPKLLCPRLQRAIPSNLIMLDGLRGRDKASVKRCSLLVIFHDLFAFSQNTLDRLTGLAASRLSN